MGYRGRHRPPSPPLLTRMLWAATAACFGFAVLVGVPLVVYRGSPAQGAATPAPVSIEPTTSVDIAEEIARAIEPDYAARLTSTEAPATTTAPSETVSTTPPPSTPARAKRALRTSSERAAPASSSTNTTHVSSAGNADSLGEVQPKAYDYTTDGDRGTPCGG